MKRITTLIVTALLFSACGNIEEEESSEGLIIDKPCPPPVGTKYIQEAAKIGGNCPLELDQSITSSRIVYEIEPDEICGMSSTNKTDTRENGCKITMTSTQNMTANGPEDAIFTVEFSCPGRTPCESTYEIFSEEQ